MCQRPHHLLWAPPGVSVDATQWLCSLARVGVDSGHSGELASCSSACSSPRSSDEGGQSSHLHARGTSISGPEMIRLLWETCSTPSIYQLCPAALPNPCLQKAQLAGGVPSLRGEVSACLLRNLQ